MLKQFIDVVSQPGLLYRPDDAARGLLTQRKAAIIRTSSGYGPTPPDGTSFPTGLEAWLRWSGMEEVRQVLLRHDPAAPEAALSYRLAENHVRELGSTF
ncbi:NAD(P)H-dependent oxidoreductase [Streptomyces heilongjiangensis]|uniref:NAD(P)H-dependent oxidoreductase n=1 Tax=Streptomyces heilongjiangensis TaxID=945052 RepID=A0ABW1BFR2_9ACTN